MRRSKDVLFVAVDVGTSGARAVAVNLSGEIEAEVRRAYRTYTPAPGFAQQDPRDWTRAALGALRALPPGVAHRVAAIGLTGQCPTIAAFDERGHPLTPGMMYRDNRAVAEALAMRNRLGAQAMHTRVGHVAEAFHIGPKVLWLRRHCPDVFAKTRRFMQPRDAVLQLLTGGVATDETHANATLFFDLRRRAWAPDLFAAFDLDPALFPEALPPSTVAGELVADVGLPPAIPVVVGAADSQCAAYGAGVTGVGLVSEMAGSSSCVNSVVSEPLSDPHVAHYSHVIESFFTTEVGVNTSGTAISWAVEQFGYPDYASFESDAASFMLRRHRGTPRDMAPLFLPYLGDGERDNPDLRGSFANLSLRHDRAAMAYSVIEGVALAVCSTLGVLNRAGSPTRELRVSGGGARIGLLGQVKADLLGAPVVHLEADATATGAALLAASRTGYQTSTTEALATRVTRAARFEPDPARQELSVDRMQLFEAARLSE